MISRILNYPPCYNLWQLPFYKAKMKLFLDNYTEISFICSDVCTYDYCTIKISPKHSTHYLLNSLLHHLSDYQVRQLFLKLKQEWGFLN